MSKIAITGNIASGKSTVENILKAKGYKVLDTDAVGHVLLENSEEVKNAFKDYDILSVDDSISREKLGRIVFNDKKMLERLNSILHPQIREKIWEFLEENKDEKFIFVSVPLLFEAGMESMFDKIIFVYADDELRLERLIKRNGVSQDYAHLRLASQASQDEKLSGADFIIYNNGSVEDLERQINELF